MATIYVGWMGEGVHFKCEKLYFMYVLFVHVQVVVCMFSRFALCLASDSLPNNMFYESFWLTINPALSFDWNLSNGVCSKLLLSIIPICDIVLGWTEFCRCFCQIVKMYCTCKSLKRCVITLFVCHLLTSHIMSFVDTKSVNLDYIILTVHILRLFLF